MDWSSPGRPVTSYLSPSSLERSSSAFARRRLSVLMSSTRLFAELQPGVGPMPWTKMRALGMIPVVLVLFIFAGAYYAAVPVSLAPALSKMPLFTALMLLLYHTVFLLALSSFLLAVLTNPGQLPAHFKIPKMRPQPLSEFVVRNANTPVSPPPLLPPPPAIPEFLKEQWERTYSGERRYCYHCLGYKPDRTHHCRQCGTCIRRMDHHCVFVNNCVGFFNYKFFILFLVYASVGCALTTTFAGPNFASIITRGKLLPFGFPMEVTRPLTGRVVLSAPLLVPIKSQHHPPVMGVKEIWFILGYVMATAFTFALGIFNSFHLWLLLKNRTTIEQYETSDPLRYSRIASYNMGWQDNLRAALGKDMWTWLLPIRLDIPGDGVNYGPIRSTSQSTGNDLEIVDPLIENQIDV